jgi:hypothetical protein
VDDRLTLRRASWPNYLPAAIFLALAVAAFAWPDAPQRELGFRPTVEAEAMHRRAHEGEVARERSARAKVGGVLAALALLAFGVGIARARRDAQADQAAIVPG